MIGIGIGISMVLGDSSATFGGALTDTRITEASDTRITEAGDTRITE